MRVRARAFRPTPDVCWPRTARQGPSAALACRKRGHGRRRAASVCAAGLGDRLRQGCRLNHAPRYALNTSHARTRKQKHAHMRTRTSVSLCCLNACRGVDVPRSAALLRRPTLGVGTRRILKRKCTLNSLVTSYYERTRALTFENVCQEQQHQQSPLEEDAGRRQHQHGHVSAACEAAHCVPRRRHFPLVAGALGCNLVPVYV